MDPNTGDVFRLRESLVTEYTPGDLIDRQQLQRKVDELARDATLDEAAAAARERLVAISEEAATRLKLGERERERRRRRRKAEKRARRANRP